MAKRTSTEQTGEMLPRIQTPTYSGDRDKNEDRSLLKWRRQGVSAGYPCFVCNTFTGPNPALMVHLCAGGAMVADSREAHLTTADWETLTIEERAAAAGCLAMYPIGAECLRRNPALRPYVVRP